MTDLDTHVVRPPKQERSRASWNRALAAGLQLLQEGGLDAVTVADVCRRGRISPPSLYARIDGRAGLIAAVYEYGMTEVRATERKLLAAAADETVPTEERIRIVATGMTEVFSRHRPLMRPIIAASVNDGRIHARGVEEAARAQKEMVRLLQLPDAVGGDIAAMIFAEVVMRTVYGTDFSARGLETDEAFIDRLTRMGAARALRD